jgi:hypothetical protein
MTTYSALRLVFEPVSDPGELTYTLWKYSVGFAAAGWVGHDPYGGAAQQRQQARRAGGYV